jgi:hypothetical protein
MDISRSESIQQLYAMTKELTLTPLDTKTLSWNLCKPWLQEMDKQGLLVHGSELIKPIDVINGIVESLYHMKMINESGESLVLVFKNSEKKYVVIDGIYRLCNAVINEQEQVDCIVVNKRMLFQCRIFDIQ